MPIPLVPATGNMSPDTAALMLEENFHAIRWVVRTLAKHAGLNQTEQQDFESFVWFRLVDREYRVLRAFRGRSSLHTYLRTVLGRALLDFRGAKWGKWRPSAEARRAGRDAVAFERLVVRDGVPIEVAQSRVPVAPSTLDRVACTAYAKRIECPLDAIEQRATGEWAAPDARLAAMARGRLATRVSAALKKTLSGLTAEERHLLWLRHGMGTTVADVAVRLGCDQKPLYRRYARIYTALRMALNREGIERGIVADVVGASETSLSGVLAPPE